MKEYAKSFYSGFQWKQTRKAYAKSKHNLCERCMAKGLFVPGEIVHHKIHLTPANINDPDVAYSWDNLELVCYACHNEEHEAEMRRTKVHSRFDVDEFGRVTAKF